MPIQFLFTLVFGYVVFLTWRRAFGGNLSYVAAGAWTLLWVVATVVVWRPETTNVIAWTVGIGRGADLVLYVSVAALFYALFRQTLRIERMEQQLTRLVRKMSIDEWRGKGGRGV